jgi:NAD/NADP transhydrogenase beta subunit
VALGFIGQISEVGDTFNVFALTALPTLYVLGIFTFVRTIESGVEDLVMGRAINRIRNYYLQIAGEEARYFMLSAHDDAIGVIRNMGITLRRRQQLFTTGAMVAVINSVVGGAAVAIAVGAFVDAPLGVCAGIGGVAAIASLVWLLRMEHRLYQELGGFSEVLFPSPEAEAAGGE